MSPNRAAQQDASLLQLKQRLEAVATELAALHMQLVSMHCLFLSVGCCKDAQGCARDLCSHEHAAPPMGHMKFI